MKCLDESIKHWQRLLELVHARNVDGILEEDWHGDSCACCTEFYADDCQGCPVMLKTGYEDCSDTPWYDASIAFGGVLSSFREPTKVDWDTCVTATEAEIEFLRSCK